MVREIEYGEIPAVVRLMKGFEKESKHAKLNVDYAIARYQQLIKSGLCTVLLLIEDDIICGSFGFIVFPDINTGIKTAVESFWWVHPSYRGKGMSLKKEFERICDERKIPNRCLIHLIDSHPEVLKKLYKRDGYEEVESHFLKVVKEFL